MKVSKSASGLYASWVHKKIFPSNPRHFWRIQPKFWSRCWRLKFAKLIFDDFECWKIWFRWENLKPSRANGRQCGIVRLEVFVQMIQAFHWNRENDLEFIDWKVFSFLFLSTFCIHLLPGTGNRLLWQCRWSRKMARSESLVIWMWMWPPPRTAPRPARKGPEMNSKVSVFARL